MDAARKSFEITSQVRQNAEDIKNVMNDLYSWEKEIKDKEKKLQNTPPSQDENILQENKKLNIMPTTTPIMPGVRSHIPQEQASRKQDATVLNDLSGGGGGGGSSSSKSSNNQLDSPSEKRDTALDPLQLKHKEANEIKDRGNSYVKLAKYDEAIEQYNMAIDLYPDDSIYYCNRALCYLKLERYDECIDDCDRATDIDNLAVKAYYRRMQANEALGNNMDALKDCTTVLMIEPKNSEATRSLERINERLRRNAKTSKGPNFSNLRSNLIDILPIEKPAYKRSTKPLKRIAIADVVGPKECKDHENLKISDEDIDKLFNSNCGYFEEVKNPEARLKAKEKATKNQTKPVSVNKDIPNNKKEAAENKLEKTMPKYVKETAVKNSTKGEMETKISTASANVEDSNKLESKQKETATTVDVAENNRPLPEAPKSTAQFYSNWKELNPQQKYQYLKSIQVNHLSKILGAGFDSDTLTDVIRTLHDFYLANKEPSLASTLLEVSKNNQIPILSLLMSNEERKALSEIVNSLKGNTSEADTSTAAVQIMKRFNLV